MQKVMFDYLTPLLSSKSKAYIENRTEITRSVTVFAIDVIQLGKLLLSKVNYCLSNNGQNQLVMNQTYEFQKTYRQRMCIICSFMHHKNIGRRVFSQRT